jgi:molybdenum cofactor guanylyltransferase
MGRDKARLRLGGRTLLGHVRRAAADAGLSVRVIRRDLVARCGPMGGIYTGLCTSKVDVVLFLSCDMPFVTSSLLHRLLQNFTPETSARFVGAEFVGFPFALRRDVIPRLASLIEAKRFSIQQLAQALETECIPLLSGEDSATLNVNTPEDFSRARQIWPKLASDRRRNGFGMERRMT